MAGILQRQGIPGDGASAPGQEQGGKDLARMVEDKGDRLVADARLALRLDRPLLRLCRSLPPHDGGQIEVVVRLISKSITQGDRSVFEEWRLWTAVFMTSLRREHRFLSLLRQSLPESA